MKKSELRKLRKRLPHRYSEELGNRTGAKREMVYMIMTGQREDYYGVIRAAADWAREIDQQEQEIRQIINNDGKS